MIRLLAYAGLSAVIVLGCMLLAEDALVRAEWFFPLILIGAGSVSYMLIGCGTARVGPPASGGPYVAGFVVFAVALSGLSAAAGWLSPALLLWVGLAAFAEEVAFRYLPWLLVRRIGMPRRWMVPLLTSLLFVLSHPLGDIWLVIDRFVFGIGAYALCAHTGTWLVPVAVHMVSNLLVSIMISVPMMMPLGLVVLGLDAILLLGSLWVVRREIARRSSLTVDLHCNTI